MNSLWKSFYLPLTFTCTTKLFVGLVEIWHSYVPSSDFCTGLMDRVKRPECSWYRDANLASEVKVCWPTAKICTSEWRIQDTCKIATWIPRSKHCAWIAVYKKVASELEYWAQKPLLKSKYPCAIIFLRGNRIKLTVVPERNLPLLLGTRGAEVKQKQMLFNIVFYSQWKILILYLSASNC